MDGQQLVESQLREQLIQEKADLCDLQEQLDNKVSLMNETCSEELAQLHSEVNNLQTTKVYISKVYQYTSILALLCTVPKVHYTVLV